jgi:hypothetical protein
LTAVPTSLRESSAQESLWKNPRNKHPRILLVDGEKPAFDWFSKTERDKDNIRPAGGTKISMYWRKLGSDDKKLKKQKLGLNSVT